MLRHILDLRVMQQNLKEVLELLFLTINVLGLF